MALYEDAQTELWRLTGKTAQDQLRNKQILATLQRRFVTASKERCRARLKSAERLNVKVPEMMQHSDAILIISAQKTGIRPFSLLTCMLIAAEL
jgi:hypothetical protein